jgi:RNA polymerase sigma-70 factor, ECF subfamily
MSNVDSDGEDRTVIALEAEDTPWAPDEDGSPEALLQTCADLDDVEAWEEFIARFNPLIVASVVRTIRRYDRAGLVDDLVQDVYLKFAANRAKVLREFKPMYPGGVFGYIKVIAANVVHDYFKSKPGKPGDLPPLPADVVVEDETEWRILLRDIDDVLRAASISPRDRQIFWLYYRQGMSAKEIAAIASLKLTVKGVESVIVRLNQLIREAFEKKAKGNRAAHSLFS